MHFFIAVYTPICYSTGPIAITLNAPVAQWIEHRIPNRKTSDFEKPVISIKHSIDLRSLQLKREAEERLNKILLSRSKDEWSLGSLSGVVMTLDTIIENETMQSIKSGATMALEIILDDLFKNKKGNHPTCTQDRK